MKSVGQLLDEINELRKENDILRQELRRAKSNVPQYFGDEGIPWWFKNGEAQQ